MNWYNDDDSESTNANWKNSEIITSFAKNFIDPMLAAEAKLKADKEAEVLSEPVRQNSEPDNLVSTADLAEAEEIQDSHDRLDDVIETLADFAVESVKSGNEKATYMIERTMEEMRALKNGEQNAV